MTEYSRNSQHRLMAAVTPAYDAPVVTSVCL